MDPASFYQQHRQPLPAWAKEQIRLDLSHFNQELSNQALDHLFAQEKEHHALIRVKVFRGQITIEKSQVSSEHLIPVEILSHFFALHELIPLPDIDFIFSEGDTLPLLPEEIKWPIFVLAKQQEGKGILFPDWYSLKGFEPAKSEILEGSQLYPWHLKAPILFFRGADSGVLDLFKWKDYPRAKLVALSLLFPHIIDARFAISLHHQSMLEMATREGYLGNYISLRDHPYYKYLMDIDGNCAATPRFPLLMCSNSVIFKNMTHSVLWFYRAVEPYTHFIPVAEDLSNLLDQLDWAKKNDQACIKISKNANRLAQQIFRQEMAYTYLHKLLQAYSIKQRLVYD
jgi:hypothetical protein